MAAAASPEGWAQRIVPEAPLVPVWEQAMPAFGAEDYAAGVETLIQQFEVESGTKLVPGEKKRVGLKIYADSVPGLATPVPLVKALTEALVRRGYREEDVFLVGLNQLRLRFTGYLPSLATGRTAFPNQQIYVLESGRFYDTEWFYDSPLPTRFDPVFAAQQIENVDARSTLEEDRRSFLATPLFLEADFWINLPVYSITRRWG